jgi:hypothetical protein
VDAIGRAIDEWEAQTHPSPALPVEGREPNHRN